MHWSQALHPTYEKHVRYMDDSFIETKCDFQEAQESFAFYRNAAFDSKIVLHEMDTLRRAFNPVMDDDEGKCI